MKLMNRKKRLPLPIIFAIAATRGIMGVGAGLLLSSKLEHDKRKKVGMALFGVGAATTVPLGVYVRNH